GPPDRRPDGARASAAGCGPGRTRAAHFRAESRMFGGLPSVSDEPGLNKRPDDQRFLRARPRPTTSQCAGGAMSSADKDLVRKAQNGDRTAFEELVRRTSRLAFARLVLETGDAHRAEDLLQETLLQAYRSLSQLSDPGGFRPWLLTIAQNVAI